MSFAYTPMTEEQLSAMNLMEEGVYDFEVIKSTLGTSRSGNSMITLQLTVWDKDGKQHTVYDYLVSIQSMAYKTKHFCDTTGLETEYKEGKFNESLCLGRSGKAKIIISEGQMKPDGSKYSDKNSVQDYVKLKIVERNMPKNDAVVNEAPIFDDDIPF